MSERQFDIIIEKLDELLVKNEELEKRNAIKDDELTLLREQVAYLTEKLYGHKKKSLDYDPNQGTLFDDFPFIEPKQTGAQSDEVMVIKEHGRKKRFEGITISPSTDGRSHSRNKKLFLP